MGNRMRAILPIAVLMGMIVTAGHGVATLSEVNDALGSAEAPREFAESIVAEQASEAAAVGGFLTSIAIVMKSSAEAAADVAAGHAASVAENPEAAADAAWAQAEATRQAAHDAEDMAWAIAATSVANGRNLFEVEGAVVLAAAGDAGACAGSARPLGCAEGIAYTIIEA